MEPWPSNVSCMVPSWSGPPMNRAESRMGRPCDIRGTGAGAGAGAGAPKR